MSTLYFDCTSGISGDMTVAALLDLGADKAALISGLKSLGVDGYTLKFGRVNKNGIDSYDFDVILPGVPEQQSHPQDYCREHDHGHPHTHDEGIHHHHHSHDHRSFSDIKQIIASSGITPRAKQYAIRIFEVLARAEAKIHGGSVGEVHFHEVGAIDSIVDVVGTAILVDAMGVERIICSTLTEGKGKVKCRHGWIPIPAPATLEIAKTHKIPLKITERKGELVTPTGAAIIAALATDFAPPTEFVVEGIGYGAGKRSYPDSANVLRVMLINEQVGDAGGELVCEITCNLDDISGEALAFACETLLGAGALDVWVSPIGMKKGRSGQLLSLICHPPEEEKFSRLLLRHTTTIGVRSCLKKRLVMERTVVSVDTRYGKVEVKESMLDEVYKAKVEFESAKKLAIEHDLPVGTVINAAYSALANKSNTDGS